MTGSDGGGTGFGYDGNGNQVAKVERPAGGLARTWTYGYDQDNRLVNVSHHSEQPTATRWATGATASSSLYPGGESAATGAPNTSVCGTTATGWTPMMGGGSAWLQASYAPATAARGLRIHETGSTPSVKQVELVEAGGARHTVWSGTDATPCGGDLQVAFPDTSYPVAGVRVTTAAGMGVGLDAIGLEPVPTQGPEEQVAAYQYDANGLRVRKVDSGGDRSFLLDGLSIAAEYSAPGVREAWYTQSLARIDEVLSVVNGQGKYWYQADALGSVYALTTASGSIQARGGYDVFGEPVALGGTAVGQPFGFTGREHEVDSGLTYHRDRYMRAAFAAWTQADRIGLADGARQYQYARSSPVLYADPTGRMPLLLLMVFGAAIGGVWSAAGAIAQGLPFDKVALEFAWGAAMGAVSVLNLVPGLGAVWGAAISNAVLAVATTVVAQRIAGRPWSWDMLPSAVISGLMAGILTLVAGPARFAMRGLARDFTKEIGVTVTAHDAFTLVTNFGPGQFDFFLQSLLMPAFETERRKQEIDYMLACAEL